jgi:hypothetical protein
MDLCHLIGLDVYGLLNLMAHLQVSPNSH